MTLQACYDALGGDYADVSARLHSDRLVQKFILKYLKDPNFDLLCTAMQQKDYEEAFRAAHTIKGMCQNLSFTRLLKSSSELAEALRYGWTPQADKLMEQVRTDQLTVTEAIRAFSEECEGQ